MVLVIESLKKAVFQRVYSFGGYLRFPQRKNQVARSLKIVRALHVPKWSWMHGKGPCPLPGFSCSLALSTDKQDLTEDLTETSRAFKLAEACKWHWFRFLRNFTCFPNEY